MSDYLLFIDESGDPSLKSINEDFPIFVLLGLLIHKDDYALLDQQLNQLKEKYFGSGGAILHSTDIRKCNGVFAVLFDLQIKQLFYNDLNQILTDANFKLVASVINKQKHIRKYGKLADDPYQIGLTFLLERMLFAIDGGDHSADVIIESRGKKEDAILASRFNSLIFRGSRVAPDRFLQKYGDKLTFKRKRENDNGLQAADLCAYPVARKMLYPDEPYPTFEIIQPKFRRGPRGIRGYGIKMFP